MHYGHACSSRKSPSPTPYPPHLTHPHPHPTTPSTHLTRPHPTHPISIAEWVGDRTGASLSGLRLSGPALGGPVPRGALRRGAAGRRRAPEAGAVHRKFNRLMGPKKQAGAGKENIVLFALQVTFFGLFSKTGGSKRIGPPSFQKGGFGDSEPWKFRDSAKQARGAFFEESVPPPCWGWFEREPRRRSHFRVGGGRETNRKPTHAGASLKAVRFVFFADHFLRNIQTGLLPMFFCL